MPSPVVARAHGGAPPDPSVAAVLEGRPLQRGGDTGTDADAEVDDAELTPLDRYRRAQHRLTAVDRFSQRHEADLVPLQARYYRDLLPASPPGPGQQYAFEVDLDACTGCKACVSACHSLNGLDDDESFRSVGLLVGAEPGGGAAWQQTVTTTCHHCLDPACLNGCPVDAYEKDPVTGIVVHLDDQCIGCSYCTLTCPYEVPRINEARGIVRKCDMCRGRLEEGEAPACVQGCPNEAIAIAVVDHAAVVAEAGVAGTTLVPTAPVSALSQPTTRYRTKRAMPASAEAGDHHAERLAHGHTPLAVMLVLTQLSVGAFVALAALRRLVPATATDPIRPLAAAGALGIGLLALGASVLHLGRPQYVWRAVIGLGHSWLSREIVAFGSFATVAAGFAVSLWLGGPTVVTGGLEVGVVVAGLVGLACSVQIYAVTGRRWWRLRTTTLKFSATAAVAGTSFVVLMATVAAVGTDRVEGLAPGIHGLLVVVIVAGSVKLLAEATVLSHLLDPSSTDLRRTARLLTGPLRRFTLVRFVLGVAGALVAPAALMGMWAEPELPRGWALGVACASAALVVAGELVERRTFFTAVSSPRMPGALR